MEIFSLNNIRKKVQEIVKEYLSEEFLKSLETSEDYIPDLEYSQTLSDSVIDLPDNNTLSFFYQARTDNIEAIDFLCATYHKVLKNIKMRIQVYHSLNQELIFEDTASFTIEDNSRIQFLIKDTQIHRNTPLTISLTVLSKGKQQLALWYGRNVNVYGGYFRVGDNKISGYPAFRVYAKERPLNTPSLSLTEPNIEFLEKIKNIKEQTKKEHKQIIEDYESLFQSILKENKQLEEQIEILQKEKEELLQVIQNTSVEKDTLLEEKKTIALETQAETEDFIQRAAQHQLRTFQRNWNNVFKRLYFIFKYRLFLKRKSGEFPIIDLTAGIVLEQAFSLDSSVDKINLFWGTHDRKNKGMLELSLYDGKAQLLKREELRMENMPNLSPVPFYYNFQTDDKYFLKICCPDGVPGNCISPMGTRKKQQAIEPVRLNGYSLPAVIKMGYAQSP